MPKLSSDRLLKDIPDKGYPLNSQTSWNMFLKPNSRKLKKTLGNILFILAYRTLSDLLADIIYNAKFPWSLSPVHYIESLIVVLLVLEVSSRFNEKVELKFVWAKKTFPRFVVLLAVVAIIAMVLTPAVMFLSGAIRNDLGFDHVELAFSILSNWGLASMILTYDLVIMLLKRWRESVIEVERFKKESIEFRFETLKNQVNPHFLFNSLNTLSSLIHLDTEAADKFLRQLSKVYRYVLENREKEVISLETELQTLNSYIYLVQMRFKDKLEFNINIPDQAMSLGIAPMTLQMLIENAIKHNELSKQRPLVINISAEGHEYIKVENIIQLKPGNQYSTKVGLSNIRSRYQYLSEKKLRVDTNNGTFTVKIPLLANTEN